MAMRMILSRCLAASLALCLTGLAPLGFMARSRALDCCCAEICLLAAKKGGGCRLPSSGAWKQTCPHSGGAPAMAASLTPPGILPQPLLLEELQTGEPFVFRLPVPLTLQPPRPPTPPPKSASSPSLPV
jgi:hypothetical protein